MRRVLLIGLVAVMMLAIAPMAVSASTATQVNAGAGLRLRSGPGLWYGTILTLSYGETVYITGGAQWGSGISWTPVSVQRWGHWYSGYCATMYLGGGGGGTGGALRVTAGAGLRLRWGPGKAYGVYRVVPCGTKVWPMGVYQWADGIKWAKVSYNGYAVWAAAAYLQ